MALYNPYSHRHPHRNPHPHRHPRHHPRHHLRHHPCCYHHRHRHCHPYSRHVHAISCSMLGATAAFGAGSIGDRTRRNGSVGFRTTAPSEPLPHPTPCCHNVPPPHSQMRRGRRRYAGSNRPKTMTVPMTMSYPTRRRFVND